MNKALFSIIFFSVTVFFQSSIVDAQPAAGSTIGLCKQAVSLGNSYIEAMENIDRQRLETGDVSSAEHSATLAQLAVQSQSLSVSLCMASQGEQLAFYQCLATHSGKVPACLN